ncbi:unnamed protein product [Urochloa decumbens]|uniref:Glabrous enhancer-binding protein-like DBD domain-containing protein n=1 Tax=Urochloa decumbens TaxID=240449 RepID=A0ABC9G0Y8_9POAL
MGAKRRARRSRSEDSVELDFNGFMKPKQAKTAPPPPLPEGDGSEEEEQGTETAEKEIDKSGNARLVRHSPVAGASKPKEMPKGAEIPSPPPTPEDVEVRDSGEASPVRDAPIHDIAFAAPPPRKKFRTKKTTKRVKRPPPPSEEERAHSEVEESGDPSPVSNVPADGPASESQRREVVASPDHNKRGATPPSPKRAKRGATPPQAEEEHAEKRPAGAGGDGTGEPQADTGAPADKVKHKKKKKKKHQKVLAKPPQPDPAGLGLTGNIEEAPEAHNTTSSKEKDSFQEEEQQGEEMVEQDHAGNISLPQANDGAHEKEQQRKVLGKPPQPDSAELEQLTGNIEEAPDTRNTTSPKEKDSALEEEQQGEEMVEQDHARNTTSPQEDSAQEEEQQGEEVAEQEQADNTPLPQEDSTQDDNDMGVDVSREALPERNASLPKLCTSNGEKKPAVERSWSREDELKILTALVEHAQSHGGALPDSSDLLAKLTFDKTDANADKLDDKIRKLRARYRRLSSKPQSRPTDDLGHRLFELSEVLWGQFDDDVRAEAAFVTGDSEFSQRSRLYPYLAREVKVYAETHGSGNLIMEGFTTISDDKARRLDAMCRKQRVDMLNLEMSQINLTKAVVSELSSEIN